MIFHVKFQKRKITEIEHEGIQGECVILQGEPVILQFVYGAPAARKYFFSQFFFKIRSINYKITVQDNTFIGQMGKTIYKCLCIL